MRLLVCGSRWARHELCHKTVIREAIERVIEGKRLEVIIHGAARGVDTIAGELSGPRCFDVSEAIYRADWVNDGPHAGPIRNQRMLDHGKPDLVLAFPLEGAENKGTRDMVRRARKAGVPVEIVELLVPLRRPGANVRRP